MNVLVTGGAGFIGSHIIDRLIRENEINLIRCLDNFSFGRVENISHLIDNPKFDLMEGDICNLNDCINACKDITHISHQAAIGSIPRSLNDPVSTSNTNIIGTINLLHAANKSKSVNRFVFASSSSVYGNSLEHIKLESDKCAPISPYAFSKLAGEQYLNLNFALHSLEYICLRYFNVFGPRQRSDSHYSAVIPIFINKFLQNERPFIFGDGNNSRDFTYIDNIVNANFCALFVKNKRSLNQVYNIGCGHLTTLNELCVIISDLVDMSVTPIFKEPRIGDISKSVANIDKAKELLKYLPQKSLKTGLWDAINYYKKI